MKDDNANQLNIKFTIIDNYFVNFVSITVNLNIVYFVIHIQK